MPFLVSRFKRSSMVRSFPSVDLPDIANRRADHNVYAILSEPEAAPSCVGFVRRDG
jgi:hypothetical protein